MKTITHETKHVLTSSITAPHLRYATEKIEHKKMIYDHCFGNVIVRMTNFRTYISVFISLPTQYVDK